MYFKALKYEKSNLVVHAEAFKIQDLFKDLDEKSISIQVIASKNTTGVRQENISEIIYDLNSEVSNSKNMPYEESPCYAFTRTIYDNIGI